MTRLIAVDWDQSRSTSPASASFDRLTSFVAIAVLLASSAATVLEQSTVDGETSEAQRTTAEKLASVFPAKETMVGAYMGAPHTYPSAVRIEKEGAYDFAIDPVHWKAQPFKSPVYYGARVARWFTGGRTGMMVDFIHSKAMADLKKEAAFSGTLDGKPLPPRAKISEIVKKLEFSHGHNMLTLNGLLRLPNIGARLSPYVGAGAGVLLPHTEVKLTNGDPRTYEYNYAGPAGQALIGLEFRLSRMSVFLEYKFTYAQYEAPLSQMNGSWLFLDIWRQIQRWMNGEEPPGGHVSTRLASHQLVGGLAVRFAAPPAAP
jgi:lipid A oxidase